VSLELVDELSVLGIPDSNDRIEGTGSEEFAVGREYDRGYSGVDRSVLGDGDIFDSESE